MCKSEKLKMESEITELQSKLETITTKESKYSIEKEDYRNKINKMQILPKNSREP